MLGHSLVNLDETDDKRKLSVGGGKGIFAAVSIV